MPAKGFQKPDPVDHRLKVQLTKAQHARLEERANSSGMTQAKYVRALIANDLGEPAERPSARQRAKLATRLELAEVHALAMQVKKLGTNINQLAHQANAGMVPVSRAEIQYVLNQHQELLSKAIAYIEAAIP